MSESEHEVSQLRARIFSLEQSLERLTEAVSRSGQPNGRAGLAESDGSHVTFTGSRRQILKLAGAAAVGAAGASLATATSAGATTGTMTFGTANDSGGDATTLTSSNDSETLLVNSESTHANAAAVVGFVASQNPGGFSSALRGENSGTGGLGIGVWGSQAGGGWGMYATSASGIGLNADGGTGRGVNASGDTGVMASGSTTGVAASGGRGLVASGSVAQVQLTPGGAATHPASGAAGDLYEDNTGALWLCIGGTTWRKLGGRTTAGQLHVLASPVRVYDSRKGDGPLAGGAERTVSLATGFVGSTATPAVPAGARAALFTLTVVDTGTQGFLAAFSNAGSWPGTSNVNWFQASSVVATSVTSAVDSSAKVKLHCGVTSTDFVVDVTGYYE